jgi:two-component system CheB/CheR fusion protein
MSELGIQQLQNYRNYIFENEEEVKVLSREFLINVTKFFRDPEAFEYLRTEVIPSILSPKNRDDSVKVWIVACSSGEEAYSLGILFLEYFDRTGKFFPNLKIFATDIDADALEIASRGLYGSEIKRDVPNELVQKYFIHEGDGFRVVPDLRKLVVFANHDVLQDPPFSRLDLIICRNMFIYINSTLQRKALKKFHFALNVNSYLMLGPSESIGVLKDVTQEINRKWKIYRCVTKRSPDAETMFVPLENTVFPKNPAQDKNRGINLAEVLKDTLLEDRKVALILIDKDFNVKHATGSYKSFLSFPEENFNFNLIKLVSPDLSVALGVAVRKAISENAKCTMKQVAIREQEGTRFVNIIVKPYQQKNDFQNPFISVVIEEAGDLKPAKIVSSSSIENNEQVFELEKELTETRESLQAVIEEMETVNEELQSSNEEMISTNEELQSTNEELQSLNEELHTVSAEHQLKIKELYELNDDLNNYFNNSEIGQVLVDNKMMIRKFSPAIKKMVNLMDVDIGRSLIDITTNLKNVNFINEVSKVIQTSNSIVKEVQIQSGSYYLMRISPYVRRDKTTDGVVINFIDISQTKSLASIIEGIFESSTNGITAKKAIRDKNNKIVDFEYLTLNRSAEKMFNVKQGSLIGKCLRDVFKEAPDEYLQVYSRVVETGISAQLEFYQASNDRWFETTVVKMLDGIVTTHTDITERKKSADVIAQNYKDLKLTSDKLSETNVQLERSNFDLMQFASVASHDLKEPLRKIQAFGNILQSKIKNKLTEGEQSYFLKIISASNRMQSLIDDVLTLSKLSNGSSIKEKTDLNKIIRQITEDLEITIREKKATITNDLLPDIEAVPGQMHQVFQNLISNGLKFSDKNDPVISINRQPISKTLADSLGINPDNFVNIVVTDNGIGFEDKYKEKIFGIFQRLHGRNYEGTGIGLAIARKIIENHGGFIFANGKVNKGAKFQIILPLKTTRAYANHAVH